MSLSETTGRREATTTTRAGRPRSSGGVRRTPRLVAGLAVLATVVVVGVLVFDSGGAYTLHANFENASGLVRGNNVLIGPAVVGTVGSIGLTRDGQATVSLKLHGTGLLHHGTAARIYEDSLSGIASKYVELEPGPSAAPVIPNGGMIDEGHTYSEVNIDELFDSLNQPTRAGLRNLIRGEAASLVSRGKEANRLLEYLAPGLQSTSEVTAELTRDQPAFDRLIVDGGETMQALAGKSRQLTALIAHGNVATGALARQSQALQRALSLFPRTLRRSSTTLSGFQKTVRSLDSLVAATKPAVRRLPQFATGLHQLTDVAVPTVAGLDDLIHNPSGLGDLTDLARESPAVSKLAGSAFAQLIDELNASQPQLSYLRDYTPDVVAALSNAGQSAAYYDANGHYVRASPLVFPFTINAMHQLTSQPPSERYQGLQVVRDRCPGSAVQSSPDGSAPRKVADCSLTSVPPGS